MAAKHRLKQSIYTLLSHHKDGSYETQDARQHVLYQAGREFWEGGYQLSNVHGLKQKHIYYLNERWKENGLSNATIKNRNAHLRWLAEKFNKPRLMPSNNELGIGKRKYVTKDNKAIELNSIDFKKITNRYIYVQLHLQRYLGLRREEAMKIKPHRADRGTYLMLEASWCKGGRARIVPILTPDARFWLAEAKKLATAPEQSLIPPKKKYIQHRRLYDSQVNRAGIHHAHGLRHAYAQERYKTLTGWDCPKQGGATSRQLTDEQKAIDLRARLFISEELGHSHASILAIYI
jgi:hypothetical protein